MNLYSRRTVAAVFVACGVAFVATPAHATTIDVSGAEFDFANPGNIDILDDAVETDSYLYEDVAVVDGTQIDALVTVGELNGTLIGDGYYSWFDETAIDAFNGANDPSEELLEAGCYTNDVYKADPGMFDPYDFVAADRMTDSDFFVNAVDENVNGDEDRAINTTLRLCGFGDTTGYMTVTVEFQVDGSPVTLANLALHATDIDSGQFLELSSPIPDAYRVGEDTVLEVTENAENIHFYGKRSSHDNDPLSMYAAEATYDEVSSLTYRFGFQDGSPGGILGVRFETFGDFTQDTKVETLAATGAADDRLATLLGSSIVALALGFIVRRRSRFSR